MPKISSFHWPIVVYTRSRALFLPTLGSNGSIWELDRWWYGTSLEIGSRCRSTDILLVFLELMLIMVPQSVWRPNTGFGEYEDLKLKVKSNLDGMWMISNQFWGKT